MRRCYKRAYKNPGEFLSDVVYLARNMKRISRVMGKEGISSAFRERLMLAVISVYRCRYCNWFHTREALQSGVSKVEISSLLNGIINNCPEEETVALLYAQHWADSDAKPDLEALNKLKQIYGPQKAKDINLLLRMIRVGNLTGNAWDRFLCDISFGRLGRPKQLTPV
jgi:AhpD family alkylhydroperoxidase